jgi:hypothetical protein
MTEKRVIPVKNKATGETRFAEHIPGIVSQKHDDTVLEKTSEAEPHSPSMPSEAKQKAERVSQPITEQSNSISGNKKRGEKTGSKQYKPESLADYIEYAYERKGKKLADIREKIGFIRSLAKDFKLGDRESDLLRIAENDVTLAVPRQLVFIFPEFQGYPQLRNELFGFVKKAILQHPLFREQPQLISFINQGDFSSSALEAMRLIQKFGTTKDPLGFELSRVELDALRRNAAYLVAVWLREMRGCSLYEVTEMLFKGVWSKATDSIKDDTDKLRAVTDISELASVAIACTVFQQQAEEQTKRALQSEANEKKLRQEIESLRAEKNVLSDDLKRTKDLLEKERKEAQEHLAKIENTQEVEVTHLLDDNQQVRHRLVKRLVSDVEQLEIGLSALRNPNPRVEVMMQRAERVVDALRVEIAKLREE